MRIKIVLDDGTKHVFGSADEAIAFLTAPAESPRSSSRKRSPRAGSD